MKINIIIDPEREEEVTVYAHGMSDAVREIERIAKGGTPELCGYGKNEIVKLDPCEISAFISEDNKVYAIIGKERLRMRERLYTLEESLGCDFVKINQSCLANLRHIQKIEASIGGSLRAIFKNGYVDYISRRQQKEVKARLGL